MQISASTERALEYITQRAGDVMQAYTAGATPAFSDVATDRAVAQSVLDPLSVALPDGTYLLARDEGTRTLYTREGALHVENGTLRGGDGRSILGFVRGVDVAPEPIAIDSVDEALGRVQNLRIEADGSVVYDRAVVDPRTGARQSERMCVGRIALARFPAATKLTVVDATHGASPAGVAPHVGVPDDGSLPPLAPAARSASRIDFDRSLEKLHDAYVAFDAVEAAHKSQGKAAKMVMDLLK